MSGAVPMAGRHILPLGAGLLILLLLPTALAVPLQADLSYEGAPNLTGDGTWSATDGFLDLQVGDGIPSYSFVADASHVTVTTHTWERSEIQPLNRKTNEARDIQTTEHTDATVHIDTLRPGARAVLSSTEWSLSARFTAATLHNAAHAWATADPAETTFVSDPDVGEPGTRLWSHTVYLQDQVLLVPSTIGFTANGTMQMTFYEGDLTVTDRSGSTHYRAGEHQEERHLTIGDQVYTAERRLLIVTFHDARVEGAWGAPGLLAAKTPTIEVAGVAEVPETSGDVVVDGVGASAHEEPFAASGPHLLLHPRVDPEAPLLPHDGMRDPIVHRAGGRLTMGGDAAHVSVAARVITNPFSNDPDLFTAATAGVGILAVAYALWRWAPFALTALYSRLDQSKVLDNPTRAEIYEIVQANPGISARQVHAIATVSWGTVVHHLAKLEAAGLLAMRRNGRAKSYYENHGKWQGHEAQLALLGRRKTRAVAEAVFARPGCDQNHIIHRIGLPQSTVSYHLLKLEDGGLVTKERSGNAWVYYPTPDLRALSQRIFDQGALARPQAPAGGTS